MGLIYRFKARKLRKTLLKQFKENIDYINRECLRNAKNAFGSVTLVFYRKTIANILIPKHKQNSIGIAYNARINAMYEALKSTAKKNRKSTALVIDIRTVGEISIKRYKEYLKTKFK